MANFINKFFMQNTNIILIIVFGNLSGIEIPLVIVCWELGTIYIHDNFLN
jgi:hypothetical protein